MNKTCMMAVDLGTSLIKAGVYDEGSLARARKQRRVVTSSDHASAEGERLAHTLLRNIAAP